MTILFVLLALPQAYDRANWVHWSRSCLDIREIVLVQESRRPVTFSADGCTVTSGEWLCPYTGELITSPGALDVDHMIALQAADRAGGSKWTRARKQQYANYLGDPDHLVAVSASANRAKGAKGPSEWMPPRKASACWYAEAWQRIAKQWGLTLPKKDAYLLEVIRAGCGGQARERQTGSTVRSSS